jgi:hypothetical protein
MVSGKKGGAGKKGGINKAVPIVLVVVVILVLVGVIVFLLASRKDDDNESSESTEKRSVLITPDNVDEVLKEMSEEEYIAPGYYEVSISDRWVFETGTQESSNAFVQNNVTNTNDVYVDVVLADDEDHVIYSSPVIPRGAKLDGIVLDEDLEPGTYDCVAIYHLVDEEQTTVSTLRIAITVVVEG